MTATTFAPAALKGLAKTNLPKCSTCRAPTPADELVRHGGECFGCESDREMHTRMLDTDF